MRTLAFLLLWITPLQARWWKAESPPHSVLSEAGEHQARDLLARLHLAHRVFSHLFPNSSHAPLPVTAYLLSTPRFRSVRSDDQTAGFYQSGPDRDFIVLEIGRPTRILFHEYAHLALHHSTGPLPAWIEEGLAEFYSTLEISGPRVRIGVPIPSHLQNLSVTSWMSSLDLSRARTGNRHGPANPVFYSQAWALVHMLRMHETYRAGFPQLLAALAAGETQAQAFQRIYGHGLPDALIQLKTYLARNSLPVMDVAIPAEQAPELRLFALAGTDGDTEFARLALQTGHGAEAAALYRKLAAVKNPSARDLESMGLLALELRDRPAAIRHLRDAIALPGAGAVAFFEYALLLREDRAGRLQVNGLLEEAVRRNPHHAEALFLLATAAANAGHHNDAVAYLQRSVAVLPRQSSFWHALALSYHALHDAANTRLSAQRALNSAQTTQDVEMARAAMRLSEPQAAAPPPPATPPRPATTARAEGVLQRVDCLGKPARLHVRVDGKPTAFWVDDPGAVLLKNQSSVTFEFRCGVIAPVPIVVEYVPFPDADRLTVGYVVGLEFR